MMIIRLSLKMSLKILLQRTPCTEPRYQKNVWFGIHTVHTSTFRYQIIIGLKRAQYRPYERKQRLSVKAVYERVAQVIDWDLIEKCGL